MKIAIFIFTILFSVLRQGISEGTKTFEILMTVNPEKLTITEKGIYLTTKNFEEILVNNLRFNDGIYYVNCPVAFACTDCVKQYENCPKICECGSQALEVVGIGVSNELVFFDKEGRLAKLLNISSFGIEDITLCGTVRTKGGADNKGNVEGQIEVEDTSDDGRFKYKGAVGYERDEDGNGTVTVEAELSWDF